MDEPKICDSCGYEYEGYCDRCYVMCDKCGELFDRHSTYRITETGLCHDCWLEEDRKDNPNDYI